MSLWETDSGIALWVPYVYWGLYFQIHIIHIQWYSHTSNYIYATFLLLQYNFRQAIFWSQSSISLSIRLEIQKL